MGNDYAQQIERQLPMVRDPEIVRYINVLGDSIARVVDERDLTWRFNVVDEAEINAFNEIAAETRKPKWNLSDFKVAE